MVHRHAEALIAPWGLRGFTPPSPGRWGQSQPERIAPAVARVFGRGYPELVEIAQRAEMESHREEEEGGPDRFLNPAPTGDDPAKASGGGSGSGGADKIVDALRSSADQEMTIAERVSGKARQAFALAAGVFVVSQTVAFGNFEAKHVSAHEKHWMIGLAIGAVFLLGVAAFATIKADATVDSRDLPLAKLEDDLNAAYEGDPDVLGRLGGYYLGVVRSRREANDTRRTWYKRARFMVVLSLIATVAELIVALVARTT